MLGGPGGEAWVGGLVVKHVWVGGHMVERGWVGMWRSEGVWVCGGVRVGGFVVERGFVRGGRRGGCASCSVGQDRGPARVHAAPRIGIYQRGNDIGGSDHA